jgi:hypothetical protein
MLNVNRDCGVTAIAALRKPEEKLQKSVNRPTPWPV